MANEKRGIQGIRTMGALLDNRRARTPAGALLELSALANEKLLIQKELDRWKRRNVEIRNRLAEIEAKERRLLALVQNVTAAPTPSVEVSASAVAGRVKVKELSY